MKLAFKVYSGYLDISQFVDTYANTSLKYVFNSPAFSEKAIVGDFSYSVSFPLTEKNKAIFYQIHLPESDVKTIEYPIEIYLEDQLIITAVFKIKTTEEKISGNIINAAYDLLNRLENKTTKDLDLGGTHSFDNNDLDVYLLASLNGTYPTYDFAFFPILNEILYDGTNVEDQWDLIKYINNWNPFSGDRVYFPYLAYVIKQLYATFNIDIENAMESNAELAKLVLVGIFKENLLDLYSAQEFNLQEHIIKYDLLELLNLVNETFNLATFFDNKQNKAKMVFKNDLLEISDDYDDWTDKVVGVVEKTFEEVDDGYNINYEFDSNDETVSSMQLPSDILEEYTIEASVLTPELLPEYTNMGLHSGEVRLVVCEDTYYIIRNFPDPNPNYIWTTLTKNFFGKKTGEALKDKSSKLSPMVMNWHKKKTGVINKYWMVPQSDQALFSDPELGIKDIATPTPTYSNCISSFVNEFQPRIMFFRGMQPDDFGTLYPLGTSGKYNADGMLIGNKTLKWDGSDGLYENHWKDWLEFKDNSKPQTFNILLNLVDILNLNMEKQVRIGANFYIKKKVNIDFPIKKAAVVELKRI